VRVRHSPRTKLHARELEYVLAVSAQVSVYGPETSFAVPQRHGSTGRPRTVARPDRQPESVRALAARLPAKSMEDAAMPDDADRQRRCRAALHSSGVVAAHPVRNDCQPPREEWLDHRVARERAGSDRLLALEPAAEDAARAARPPRPAALDDRTRLSTLKGEPGLDHYEGRSYRGFHHHCALVTCAHAFLTLERFDPKARGGLTLLQAVLLLQPVLRCWNGRCRTCNQAVDLDQLTLFHRQE
jgi:hypothetical protein